jgi:hypothetical protein
VRETGDKSKRGVPVNVLTIATLMIMAAVTAWGFTMARASAHHSRLRAEMARIEREARKEIQHWRDEAARARTHAAQIARDAANWAAGCKQGRDDVITVVPLLIAAQEKGAGGGAGSEHGAEEVIEHEEIIEHV